MTRWIKTSLTHLELLLRSYDSQENKKNKMAFLKEYYEHELQRKYKNSYQTVQPLKYTIYKTIKYYTIKEGGLSFKSLVVRIQRNNLNPLSIRVNLNKLILEKKVDTILKKDKRCKIKKRNFKWYRITNLYPLNDKVREIIKTLDIGEPITVLPYGNDSVDLHWKTDVFGLLINVDVDGFFDAYGHLSDGKLEVESFDDLDKIKTFTKKVKEIME